MKKARTVAGHYNHSSQAAAALKACAISMGITKHSVDNDVVTRWWSTHTLCESLFVLEGPLKILQAKTPVACHLSETDWSIIRTATIVLEPFMLVQKFLEGEKYVTNSLVIPLMGSLRTKLTALITKFQAKQDNEEISSSMEEKVLPTLKRMLEVFNTKFGDGTRICDYVEGPKRQPKGYYPDQVCATAVDPRTKILQGIPESEKPEVWELLKNRCVEYMMKDYADQPSSSITDTETAAVGQIAVETDIFADIFGGSSQHASQSSPALETPSKGSSKEERTKAFEAMVDLEISQYRSVPALPNMTNQIRNNPLDWWRLNEYLYPCLGKFARRVLAIPATSAPSERIFSIAGQIVTKRRNRLTGNAVTLLVWLAGAWDAVDKYIGACKKRKAPASMK